MIDNSDTDLTDPHGEVAALRAEIAHLRAERDAALAGRVKLMASRIPSTFYPMDRTGYETVEAMNAAHDAIAEDALRSYPGAGGDQVKALCMLARGLKSVIEGAKSRQVAAFTAAIQPITVQDAARVLLGDDIAIAHMAEGIHDGPLMADDQWFSAARPQGAWCVDAVRAALHAIAESKA